MDGNVMIRFKPQRYGNLFQWSMIENDENPDDHWLDPKVFEQLEGGSRAQGNTSKDIFHMRYLTKTQAICAFERAMKKV